MEKEGHLASDLCWFKLIRFPSINHHLIRHGRDAVCNPPYKIVIEAQVGEHRFGKVLVYSIIGFLEVQFNSHESIFYFSRLKTVKEFMNHYLIFCYPPPKNESRLAEV